MRFSFACLSDPVHGRAGRFRRKKRAPPAKTRIGMDAAPGPHHVAGMTNVDPSHMTDTHDTEHLELRPEFRPGPPERPAWPAIAKGLRQRCPSCGEGSLYSGYLKLMDACPSCGEDLHHARADDGPAYLSILLTAKVMGTLMLVVFERWQPPPLVLAGTFSVGVVAMALYLLPRFKGLIVGVQWAKRMHGF